MTDVIYDQQGPAPALILFRQDATGRPRAAWFDAHQAVDAERASSDSGYTALRVTDEKHQALATRLPRGRLGANGRPLVRALPRPLFQALNQLIAAGSTYDGAGSIAEVEQPTTGTVSDTPPCMAPVAIAGGRSRSLPQDWDEIGNDSLVLAYDPASKAWYEAVVIHSLNDALRLAWRDYPEEGVIMRKRNQLALLCPAA